MTELNVVDLVSQGLIGELLAEIEGCLSDVTLGAVEEHDENRKKLSREILQKVQAKISSQAVRLDGFAKTFQGNSQLMRLLGTLLNDNSSVPPVDGQEIAQKD